MNGRFEKGMGTQVHKSPSRARRDVKRRQREEKKWQSLNGPVTISRVEKVDPSGDQKRS